MAFSADYQATKKLALNFGFTYNKAEDTWIWDFDERPSLVWNGTSLDPQISEDSNGDGTTDSNTDADADGVADFQKSNYDTSVQNDNMDQYSDLSYEQYQIRVGATYNFTQSFYGKVSGTYDTFNMDEKYVYGDENGDAYYGYVGFGWTF